MGEEGREARAELAAEKARRKAMRPWYRKKRFLLPIGLVVVIVLVAILSDGGDEGSGTRDPGGSESVDSADAGPRLYPDRPDAQPEDQERSVGGEGATIDGVVATLTSGVFRQSVSEFEQDGYLVVDVNLVNQSDGAKPYNTFNWRIQTPNGQVLDPYFGGDQLGSGDLVSGGTHAGQVVFEVGETRGDFYIIWKPNAFDAARGIWKVAI